MSLAYERNVDLAFDTDVLRDCARKYADIAKELRTMSTNLDQCLLDLKENGWTTPAGTAFYEMTKTNWKENIEKYADLLETLEDILNDASKSYDDLVENHIEKTKVNLNSSGGRRF